MKENVVLTKVYVREKFKTLPMEIPYYGTGHEPVCFYCELKKFQSTVVKNSSYIFSYKENSKTMILL